MKNSQKLKENKEKLSNSLAIDKGFDIVDRKTTVIGKREVLQIFIEKNQQEVRLLK